jgi:hypothetical protein
MRLRQSLLLISVLLGILINEAAAGPQSDQTGLNYGSPAPPTEYGAPSPKKKCKKVRKCKKKKFSTTFVEPATPVVTPTPPCTESSTATSAVAPVSSAPCTDTPTVEPTASAPCTETPTVEPTASTPCSETPQPTPPAPTYGDANINGGSYNGSGEYGGGEESIDDGNSTNTDFDGDGSGSNSTDDLGGSTEPLSNADGILPTAAFSMVISFTAMLLSSVF